MSRYRKSGEALISVRGWFEKKNTDDTDCTDEFMLSVFLVVLLISLQASHPGRLCEKYRFCALFVISSAARNFTVLHVAGDLAYAQLRVSLRSK